MAFSESVWFALKLVVFKLCLYSDQAVSPVPEKFVNPSPRSTVRQSRTRLVRLFQKKDVHSVVKMSTGASSVFDIFFCCNHESLPRNSLHHIHQCMNVVFNKYLEIPQITMNESPEKTRFSEHKQTSLD